MLLQTRGRVWMKCRKADESNKKRDQENLDLFVRMTGLEPTHLSVLDPKSSAATNYATSAFASAKVVFYFYIANL